jgi:hypothetical protein
MRPSTLGRSATIAENTQIRYSVKLGRWGGIIARKSQRGFAERIRLTSLLVRLAGWVASPFFCRQSPEFRG